jgi:hypothetical protein
VFYRTSGFEPESGLRVLSRSLAIDDQEARADG